MWCITKVGLLIIIKATVSKSQNVKESLRGNKHLRKIKIGKDATERCGAVCGSVGHEREL